MKWHRIQAIFIRYLYLNRSSVPRLMDVFYWPFVDILIWGFLSTYLSRFNSAGVSFLGFLLGGLIFWDLMSQSQRAVSVSFLEDIWSRNLLNIFVTPLKISEFLSATVLLGLLRVAIVGVIISTLAFLFYHFNIFTIGIFLVPFILNLFIFGWILGTFTISMILRYGSSAEILAFSLIFLFQPVSAVFYPISALPHFLQIVAHALPSAYIFEGMRSVLHGSGFIWSDFYISLGLNIFYLILMLWFFWAQFARVKRKGLLMKLD